MFSSAQATFSFSFWMGGYGSVGRTFVYHTHGHGFSSQCCINCIQWVAHRCHLSIWMMVSSKFKVVIGHIANMWPTYNVRACLRKKKKKPWSLLISLICVFLVLLARGQYVTLANHAPLGLTEPISLFPWTRFLVRPTEVRSLACCLWRSKANTSTFFWTKLDTPTPSSLTVLGIYQSLWKDNMGPFLLSDKDANPRDGVTARAMMAPRSQPVFQGKDNSKNVLTEFVFCLG